MALTIEDGLGVVGANSYVTLVEARAFALDRGSILPTDDAVLTALLIKANDYLQAKRHRYKGTPTYTNRLQWPRNGVVIDGTELLPTDIPQDLKFAQCQLAIEIQTIDPMKSREGETPRRETIGPITVEYAVNFIWDFDRPTRLPKVDALLNPLYKDTFLGVIRV